MLSIRNKSYFLSVLVILALVFSFANVTSVAQAAGVNLIADGSFELQTQSNVGPPWTVIPGQVASTPTVEVQPLGTYPGMDGTHSVDFFANNSVFSLLNCGSVQQSVTTTAGVSHSLKFLYGMLGDHISQLNGQVFLASNLTTPIAQTGFLQAPSYDAFYSSSLTFTPTQANIVIRFTSLCQRRGVPRLDGVELTANDNTPPTASPTQSPAANGTGWNNSDVTVTWNWSDNSGGSGIDNTNCTTSNSSTGEGTIVLNATCKDLAGNTGNTSYMVMVDKTAPTAQAGDDQLTHAGVTVYLDGSTSFDNNTLPAALSYNWSFSSVPAGNTAALNNVNTATPSFTPNVSGTYIAQLIVVDDAGNPSVPAYVTLSSLNQAPTGDATATPLLPLLGQTVSLNGTGSFDPDNDAISYVWTITSKPVGSVASLTNATSSIASITPDIEGAYQLSLTVRDFLDSGTPVTVSFVATTTVQFATTQIVSASTSVTVLSLSQVTTPGNQNALSNFLIQAVSQLQNGNVANAISKLNQAIQRTDGCALRGVPDGNGPGLDWVTTCDAQASVYNSLIAALHALQP